MSVSYVLEPFDINLLKNMKTRRSSSGVSRRDVFGIIEEFIESGYDCCKVCACEDPTQAHIECTILSHSIERGKFRSVQAVRRGCLVFLVRKSCW